MLKDLPGRSGSIRRFAAVVVGTTAAAVLVAGCAAGQNAQTVGQRPPIDGASASAGSIEVRAAGVLAPAAGNSYAKGGTALLQLVLINTGTSDDTLTSISSPAAGSALVSNAGLPQTDSPSAAGSAAASSPTASASGSASSTGSSVTVSASASDTNSASSAPANTPIKLPAGQSVQIGFSETGPNISLADLTAVLYPAQPVPVTFTFSSGATVTVSMSVKLSSQAPSAPVISEATQPAE